MMNTFKCILWNRINCWWKYFAGIFMILSWRFTGKNFHQLKFLLNMKSVFSSTMVVFVPRPTERESVAQGLFWWVLTQGHSPHAPGISKNAYVPVGIPLFRGASGAGRLTKTPEGGKRLGGRPQSPRHTRPDLCRRQHGRPKCDPATECGHDREG